MVLSVYRVQDSVRASMRCSACLRWISVSVILLVSGVLVTAYYFTFDQLTDRATPSVSIKADVPRMYITETSSNDYQANIRDEKFPQRCPLLYWPFGLQDSQVSRKEYLRKWCRRNQIGLRKFMLDKSQLSSIYVNDEYKIVYCRIPKTGCTNWKKYFILLSGKTNYTRITDIRGDDAHHDLFELSVRQLGSYTPKEQREILENYFKFVIVRHPLTRLLSAYSNKFAHSNPVFEVYNRMALRYSNRSESSPGRRASLSEFLRFLTDPSGRNLLANPHWQNFHELCQPCQISYDFIGQVETMSRDSEMIVQRIGAHYEFPMFKPSSDSRVDEAFRNVTFNLIKRAVAKYRDDFEAFGYDC